LLQSVVAVQERNALLQSVVAVQERNALLQSVVAVQERNAFPTPKECINCRSLSATQPLIIGLFCGN